MTASGFKTAPRVHGSVTAALERRVLGWIAPRLPRWVTPDGLTGLGLLAQCAAGAALCVARTERWALPAAAVAIAVNWFGDSLDGTLARVRRQERPRYGFYVDHMVDLFGSVALMAGLAGSGLVHAGVALAMLLGFLLLAAESYLATYTVGRFELSQGAFGPTEIRLLLIAGILASMHSPWCTVAGHRLLLFDLGGTIGSAGMVAMLLVTTARHTLLLRREETVPAEARTVEVARPEVA